MHQPLVLPLFSPFGVNSVLVSVCVSVCVGGGCRRGNLKRNGWNVGVQTPSQSLLSSSPSLITLSPTCPQSQR